MVDAVTAATANGAAAQDAKKLADDFDDFLVLLTTQLQNQDPLDPMDSGEFTQQLVAFTGVEQQIQVNQNLELLANLSRLQNLASSASYLGTDAVTVRDLGDHNGTGIKWQYQNADVTDVLTLEVRDSEGDLVYSEVGETDLGFHEFNWDGRDADGNLVEDGNYKLEIVAKDTDDKELNPVILVQETITAVDTSGFEPLFTIGPNAVGQTEILELVHNG